MLFRSQTNQSQVEHLAVIDAFLQQDRVRVEEEMTRHIIQSRDSTYRTLGMGSAVTKSVGFIDTI